jgi:hypothetical protein
MTVLVVKLLILLTACWIEEGLGMGLGNLGGLEENTWEWIVGNKEWLFDEFGIIIVVELFRWIRRRRKPSSTIEAGNGSARDNATVGVQVSSERGTESASVMQRPSQRYREV